MKWIKHWKWKNLLFFPLCQPPCKYLQKILLGTGDMRVYFRNILRLCQKCLWLSHFQTVSRLRFNDQIIIYYFSLSVSLIPMQKYKSFQVTEDVPLYKLVFTFYQVHSGSAHHCWHKYNKLTRYGRGGRWWDPLTMISWSHLPPNEHIILWLCLMVLVSSFYKLFRN